MAKISFNQLNAQGVRAALLAEKDAASDIKSTVLVREDCEIRIRCSVKKGIVVKESVYDGRIQTRNSLKTLGPLAKYRGEIKRDVKAGWTIKTTDQDDLTK